jgi:hypothetical protein
VPLIFHIQLCDKGGNKLTDFESVVSTYIFEVKLHYDDDSSIIILQTGVTKVDISLYMIEIVTELSGWYTMTVSVTNAHSGFSTELKTKILDH